MPGMSTLDCSAVENKLQIQIQIQKIHSHLHFHNFSYFIQFVITNFQKGPA